MSKKVLKADLIIQKKPDGATIMTNHIPWNKGLDLIRKDEIDDHRLDALRLFCHSLRSNKANVS